MEVLYQLYILAKQYKFWIIGFFFIGAIVLGFYVYGYIYKLGFSKETLSYILGLFAMDVKTPDEIKNVFIEIANVNNVVSPEELIKSIVGTVDEPKNEWKLIFLASFLAKSALLLSFLLYLFRGGLTYIYKKLIFFKGDHTIIIGLGRNSRFFINSLLLDKQNRHKIIVFELDKSNTYLSRFQKKPISIISKNIEGMLDELSINKCKNLFISTGNDEQNIYLALQLLSKLQSKHKMEKLLLHIDNRTLRNLYSDKGLLKSKNVDIRLFSYYKDSARLLFQKHNLDGNDYEIISSKKEFHIIVVGHTELAISVVTEACRLAHYPNNNKLIIHCLDSDIKSFESNLEYAFPEIRNIKNVKIKFEKVNSKSLKFYNKKLWKVSNLKHVMFCYDDVSKNISILTKLKNLTYLRDNNMEGIKFHVAMMNHVKMANKLKEDNEHQKNIFSFAEANNVCSGDNLLRNEIDKIAEMIHHGYKKKELSENDMKEAWKKVSINDKRASIGQAIHLDTKLKIMNLKRVKFSHLNWSYSRLLAFNKEIFFSIIKRDLEKLDLSDNSIEELNKIYNKKDERISKKYYFPEKYDLLFEKMLKMEHNRWMAILILMDNKYQANAKNMNYKVRKELKIHHLLKPFSKFNTRYERIHIINDMHAILNIPEYLSKLGYVLMLK